MKNLGSKAMMIMLAVFAAGMISSCENTIDNEVPQNGNTITFTCEINSLSKVDVSNEGKTTWEVGDQILINAGSNGNTRETVTLKASDISADGRSAKIAVSMPAPRRVAPSPTPRPVAVPYAASAKPQPRS